MKALITGSEGFVGPYLRSELENAGYEVIGADLVGGNNTYQIDLLDSDAVSRMMAELDPDVVFHLAAIADVGLSWKRPQATMQVNIIAAINIMETIKRKSLERTKLVIVGSSDQYGPMGNAGTYVNESTAMRPVSPYAISKRAQEEMASLYAKNYGLKVCMTRSFNHSGPGQRNGFVIPDFARGIVLLERGLAKELSVGDLTSRRDFTHVKDMVRAYRLIAERGIPGEIYNVGSGVTYSIQEILESLIQMAKCYVSVRFDPAKMRPSDTPVLCCDHTKITRDTGWEAEIPMSQILCDTLNYYRDISDLS